VAHLGRAQVSAIQQLIFLLDDAGQVVIQNGGPVVTALRNCTTLTAANGDLLHHRSIGVVTPGATGSQFEFAGDMEFMDGTGRFAGASGTASYHGHADVVTNTGAFSFEGVIAY
jgi:hypothetical protein